MRFGLILSLLLLPAWMGGARAVWAGPKEEAAAYAERRREALIRHARERVRPEDPAFGAIDERAATLQEKRKAWIEIDPGRVERAQALVGTGKGDGLIREGARYYRWLREPLADGMAFILRDMDSGAERFAFATPFNAKAEALTLEFNLDLPRGLAADDNTIRIDDLELLRRAENIDGDVSSVEVWKRHRPLVLPDELTSELSVRLVQARIRQRDARLKAWAAEEPTPGFEDAERLRAREDRLSRIRQRAARWGARKKEIVDALDQMAAMELALTRETGRRTVLIEKAEEKKGGPRADQALEALLMHQWVERKELRLLYITVRRAIERLRLIDQMLAIEASEEAAAQAQLAALEGERFRLQREAQLQRIESDAYEMRTDLTEAKSALARAAEAPAATWQARIAALEARLALNEVVRRVVALRQDVEVRLRPVAMAAPLEADASVFDRLAATSAHTIDGQIERVQEYVDVIPAGLVAHLHGVCDERVVELEGIDRQIRSHDALSGEFAQARTKAEKALTAFELVAAVAQDVTDGRQEAAAKRWWVDVEADFDVYEPTWAAIEKVQQEARTKLGALRALRRDLTRLGPRSFQCRVDRKLQLGELKRAWGDVQDVAARSERWLTLRDDDNLWTFLRAQWWRVLASLAILLAGLWGARVLRASLGRWLDAQAHDVEVLDSGLSLDAEDAVQHEHEAKAAAEVKAIETTALEEAAGKETDLRKTTSGDVEPEPADDTGANE